MAIKGSLKEASLADVCQLLSLGLKSGCLAITDRSRFGEVFFERGRITHARIVNRRDRLGDLLVRAGVVERDRVDTVLAQAGEYESLANLLLAAGEVDQDTLEQFVRMQVEDAIFHLFTWSQGTFFFEPDREPEPSIVKTSIAADSVLLEAARRTDEWSLIEKEIPSLHLVFERDASALEASQVELNANQVEVLESLDGQRSLRQVADEIGLSDFDVGAAAFHLQQAGLVRERGHVANASDDDAELRERRNLGYAFYQAGMLADAHAAFQRVLELDPGDTDARFHVGLVKLRDGDFEGAVGEMRGMIDQSGPRFGAFVNLALAMRRLGRTTEALQALEHAERMAPDTPHICLIRASVRMDERRLAEARRDLAAYRSRLAEGEAPRTVYFYMAGLAAALVGERDEAKAIVEAGLAVHPESPPLLLLAGLLAERRGDPAQAEELYTRAVDLDPLLVQAHKSLGDVAYARGAHDQALQRYQRAAELAPRLGDDLYAKLGDLHYRARNREGAMRYWRTALELNPENEAVRNNLEIVSHGAP